MAQPQRNIRGVQRHQEMAPGRDWRDTRDLYARFASLIEQPEYFLGILGCFAMVMFVAPSVSEVVFLAGLGLCWYASRIKFSLPFRMPQTSGLFDQNDPSAKDGSPSPAGGIAFLGNELGSQKELWFKNEDMRTHMLIFGSTGAGKTEALISIAFNALVHGEGFIYVDGKGDSSLFAKIFAMCRSMGREDDLLVINYMTGARDVFGKQRTKLSNTLNPFTTGSSGGLTELLVSLMDEAGGDNAMWKGRAISLISSIMMALVSMRENKEILLDVDIIREYLILENIIKLSKRRDLPGHVTQTIRAYLRSLPGYQEGAQKQSETVMDQHGYLQMQFTKILGSLADAYGYIFRTNLGEVDFWDVVANRRILVVLLPALEKSPEELANLGKIIVACLKQMMATGLGSLLEGEYRKIIETRPTYSPTPFMCILDEYGYYAVKGAAVMPAQARSLGFSMVFAGQDYPAFEKASKEEAASTVANTNIKVFMKLEDPDQTYQLFEKLAGEAQVTKVGGFQANTSSMVTSYNDMLNASVQRVKRGDLLDLKEQGPGEAHVIFKSGIVRAKMFYANPETPKDLKLQLNSFVKVEPPEKDEILDMDTGLAEMERKLLDPVFMKDIADSCEPSQDVETIKEALSRTKGRDPKEQACAAVAWHHMSMTKTIDAFKAQMGKFGALGKDEEDDDDPDQISVFKGPKEEMERDRARNAKGRKDASGGDDDEDFNEEFEEPDQDEDYPVFLEEERVKSGLAKVERLSGTPAPEASEAASKIVEDIKAVSQYPHGEEPEEKGADDILDILKELDEKIDQMEDGDD